MTICIGKNKYSAKEIVADIEAYITENSLKCNMPLAPSKKLAQKYNVSSRTMERAITSLVKKGLVYRIQGKGTFVAKQIKNKYNESVGYFAWQNDDCTGLNQAAYGTFDDILVNGLKELGINVDFIICPGYRKEIISFSEAIKYSLLIIPGGMVTPQTLPWLRRLPVPVIIVNYAKILPYPFHQVYHYYELGFETALKYLKEKGEHNIFIAGLENETSQTRTKALQQTANKMGIAYKMLPTQHKMSISTSLVILHGRELGKYFLKNNLKGVIFTLSDFIALGIIDVIREYDLELGNDIKIISYDNLESRAPFNSSDAVITSITHPLKELAQEAVKLVDDILDNNTKDHDITKIIKVPAHEFVIRKSFY
jgi:DNA-binding LacI/PurR family transcriptional regulator